MSKPLDFSSLYVLRCMTCHEVFANTMATTPGELLTPNYEQAAMDAGLANTEALQSFHKIHEGHNKDAVLYDDRWNGIPHPAEGQKGPIPALFSN